MLVLLDANILTNFARVGFTSAPPNLWGDQVHTSIEVLDDYAAGIKTAGLPPLAWKQLRALVLTHEEQAIAAQMSRTLEKGESACLAVAIT